MYEKNENALRSSEANEANEANEPDVRRCAAFGRSGVPFFGKESDPAKFFLIREHVLPEICMTFGCNSIRIL